MRAGARRLPAALAIVLALVVATGCASSGDGAADGSGGAADITTSGNDGFHGAVIQNPYDLPALTFTDTAGRPFVPAEDARHAVTLVFFGYTHCPDVCNVVLANVASALRRSDAAVRDRVQLLFVTTDPDRDTPAVMRGYLDRFDPSYVGLTAPLPTIEKAARSLGIAYTGKEGATAGGYEVGHGAQVIAFTGGKGRLVWMPETPVKDLRSDLARLARA